MPTVVLRRHARHEGKGVRVSARPRPRARRRRDPGRLRDHGRAARRAGRHARGGRSGRRCRRRTRSPRRATAAPPSTAMGEGPRPSSCAPPCRGPARRHPRARRLGQLLARHAGHARAPGRRAEADGLDGRLGRHPAVRRSRRHRDDVLGRRHRRHQPDLGADHDERGRHDRRRGPRRRCRRPTARSR